MIKEQQIGVLGGTFDPVHKGHLGVARTVLARFSLDRLLFVPAASPPHKGETMTAFPHRVAMLEAALKGMDRVSVSLIEAERSGPSYTVETLRELHRRLDPCCLFLIMGADMFVEIDLWYRYEELFRLAHVIVAARPGVSPRQVRAKVETLPGPFPAMDADRWRREDGAMIFFCSDIELNISSTQLRERLRRGETDFSAELPSGVLAYIDRHGLYGRTTAP